MVYTTSWSETAENRLRLWHRSWGNISQLNKQHIAGIDLTNQLVGVLTRFREVHIEYMVDIEAMFHQMRVPENQRSLLRFLWWEHGDLRMEVEICVHLFGGNSSPSWSNYALKIISVHYQIDFTEDAAITPEKKLCRWYAKVIPRYWDMR